MRFSTLSVVCCIAMLFYACSGDSAYSTKSMKVFRYNEPAGIQWLDPAKMTKYEDFLVAQQLFNGLVALDDSLRLIPCIAASWMESNDGKSYTFFLREDVLFHSSDLLNNESIKVKAEDVAFSFNRIMDEKIASPGKYIFNNLLEYPNGIEIIDNYTLKINLKTPQPSFLYQLCLPYGSILPSEVVEHFNDDFSQNAIGTGPFQLNKWKKDVKLILSRNPSYFEVNSMGEKLPFIEGISVTFIADKNQEFINFSSGNLDMISGLDEDGKDILLTMNGELKDEFKSKFHLQKQPWLNTDYIGLLVDDSINSITNNPLRSKQLRKAIGYSIDRNTLVKFLRNGIGSPAIHGFIPKGMPGFEKYKINGFNYNLPKAKELISEINDLSSISINLAATEQYKTLCEYLQNQIQQLGVQVKISIYTSSGLRQRIANFDATFYRKSWVADFPEPINYFQLFYSGNLFPEKGYNYYRFQNEVYDSLYVLSLSTPDERKRFEYYKKMQEIIHECVPVIPLFYAETIRFFQNNVTGVCSNSMNTLSLKKVKILDNIFDK